MKIIQIGRLNKRIKFLTYTESIDELGQSKQSFEAVRTCWADIYAVRGQERYEALKIREEVQYKCYVRYFQGLNSSNYYIEYAGRKFKIDSVTDIDEQHTFYEIYCTEYVEKIGGV